MPNLTMTVEEYKEKFGKKKNKFQAERCESDGVKFDSKLERDYYLWLKADLDVVHIDCHPALTLPEGVRYRVDFITWRKTYCKAHDKNDACCPAPEAIEVKGRETSDFRIKRKLFNGCHPMRPLKVIKRQGRRWVEA